MELTREQISEMQAGREMDALIAEHIMGGFVDKPNDNSEFCHIWFWVDPKNGVLIGEPYTNEFMDGMFSHQWRKFTPSTDIAAAWLVLEKFTNFSVSRSRKTQDPAWFGFSAWVCVSNSVHDSAQGESASLAICRAALLVKCSQ